MQLLDTQADVCPNPVELARFRPSPGGIWPTWGRDRSNSGHVCPKSKNMRNTTTNLAQKRPTSGRWNRPTMWGDGIDKRIGSISTDVVPSSGTSAISTRFVPAGVSQIGLKLAKIGQALPGMDRMWPKSRSTPQWIEVGPAIGQIGSKWTGMDQTWSGIVHIWPKFGRNRHEFGQSRLD